MVNRPNICSPVQFDRQVWRTFKTLPGAELPQGPEGVDVWICHKAPHGERTLTKYTNWDNSSTKAKQKALLAEGALWCYVDRPQLPPEGRPRRGHLGD